MKGGLVTTHPRAQRAGILTQPSWLIAYGTNFDNHAIARGHWIRERLLGGTIPEIPLNVDAKLPDDKDKTLRERMHVTRADYCLKCHQKMDPLGLPFEIYSHLGRFRETETVLDPAAPPPAKGRKPATKEMPVDASGEIAGTGDPNLDGPVKNAVEMMNKLGKSPRVEQVFIRHAFRYWMGRNETVADAGTLQAAHKAYRESASSFRTLLVSLLTSDSFLYRSGDPPALPTADEPAASEKLAKHLGKKVVDGLNRAEKVEAFKVGDLDEKKVSDADRVSGRIIVGAAVALSRDRVKELVKTLRGGRHLLQSQLARHHQGRGRFPNLDRQEGMPRSELLPE